MINSESPAEYHTTSTNMVDIPIDRCPTMSDRDRKTVARAIKLLATHLQEHGEAMLSPEVVKDYLTLHLAALRDETFTVMYLDNRHRVITTVDHFHGTIDAATVYPRVILTHALRVNAAAVIFAHNHPSGITEPSKADRVITDKLKEVLALAEVRVLDHIIVAGLNTLSFAEKGLI